MRALDYKSVSTVAVHVDGLITRGLLRKKDNSARSLEVVPVSSPTTDPHIKWLQQEIKKRAENDLEQVKKDAAILKRALAILDTSKE
jgi:hypothetical protein